MRWLGRQWNVTEDAMSLSRPTASKFARKLSTTAAVGLGMLAISATPALAKKDNSKDTAPVVKEATAAVNAVLAVCPGQTFSQPFASSGDVNYYTLVEGSEFNSPSEGWELKNGAAIVEGTRPDGSSGGVLDLPRGAYAVSPAVCVTLQYPTARAYVEAAQGSGSVTVGVYYPGAQSGPTGQPVGQISAKSGQGYELSAPFNVMPQLAGNTEGVREVHFIYANTTSGDFHVSGLYVDPRMR